MMKHLSTYISGVLSIPLALIIIFSVSGHEAQAGSNKGAPVEMTLFYSHPEASAEFDPQNPSLLSQIRSLCEHNGVLVPGYGDFVLNLGPIILRTIDVNSSLETTAPYTFQTEATWSCYSAGDRLFIPATDPRGSDQFMAYQDWGAWMESNTPNTHVFGTWAGELGGNRVMVASGSLGYKAVAWYSLDNGYTWLRAMDVSSGAELAVLSINLDIKYVA